MPSERPQNKKEELANGISHGAGLLILIACMPLLYWAAANHLKGVYLWTLFPFFTGIVLTYSSSTVYHFSPRGPWKDRWRIMDHISIFFLIGGTYTPIIMQYLSYPSNVIFLGIMWGIILTGSVLKFWWTGKYDNLSTGLYVFLGWMVLFVIWPLWKNAPSDVLWWILIGGLAYSTGIYFYKKADVKYYHVVWHILVLMGTISHLIAIYRSFITA